MQKAFQKFYFGDIMRIKFWHISIAFVIISVSFSQIGIVCAVNYEQYPPHLSESYVDSVTKINALKAQGMNDVQIAEELDKLGLHFIDPVRLKINELRAKGMNDAQMATFYSRSRNNLKDFYSHSIVAGGLCVMS